MPTLIGSVAAIAQSGRMTQLPIPVATVPAIQAALCRKRLRLVEAQVAPFRSLVMVRYSFLPTDPRV